MLAEALASVRAQTFTGYEIIVVANGESPAMEEASRAAAAAHGARYFALPEGNGSAARNFGAAQARGEWIAFLDDDDLWLPHKLERQIAVAAQTRADMIVCDYVAFYPDGRESIRRPRPREGWPYLKAISHHRWCALPSTTMVRKCALDAVGGFDPQQHVVQDSDLWRRICWQHTIHQMDDVLVRYRTGHLNLSKNRWKVQSYELRHYLKMRRDTPEHLRHAIPSPISFLQRWLLRRYLPRWLRHPRKQWSLLRGRFMS